MGPWSPLGILKKYTEFEILVVSLKKVKKKRERGEGEGERSVETSRKLLLELVESKELPSTLFLPLMENAMAILDWPNGSILSSQETKKLISRVQRFRFSEGEEVSKKDESRWKEVSLTLSQHLGKAFTRV